MHNDLVGDGGDVRARLGALDGVIDGANGSGDDFAFNAVDIKNFRDFADQGYAVPAGVVHSADKGGNIGRARFGGRAAPAPR